jgi:hypothetical protein
MANALRETGRHNFLFLTPKQAFTVMDHGDYA